MQQKIFQKLEDIASVVTAHNEGRKYVFLKNSDTATNLTQFAFGELQPGEKCSLHSHATMEECFYFISGEGEYLVDETVFNLQAGVFLRIPAKTPHALSAGGTAPLKFVYFGIATE